MLDLDETLGDVAFHRKSGMRANSNCARLAAQGDGPAFTQEGGLEAAKRAGLPMRADARAPLGLNRQVQIAVGVLVLSGAGFGALAHAAFFALPAIMGAGLVFAGFSGWCGMARLLARAPWNRVRA